MKISVGCLLRSALEIKAVGVKEGSMNYTTVLWKEQDDERMNWKNIRLRSYCKLCSQGDWLSREPGWRLGVLPANAGDGGDMGSIPGLGRSPGVENRQLTPVLLLGKPHGQSSLAGYSP